MHGKEGRDALLESHLQDMQALEEAPCEGPIVDSTDVRRVRFERSHKLARRHGRTVPRAGQGPQIADSHVLSPDLCPQPPFQFRAFTISFMVRQIILSESNTPNAGVESFHA